MRKIISLTLATAMVASMAVSAFAAESVQDTAKIEKGSIAVSGAAVTVVVNGTTITANTGSAAENVAVLASKLDKEIGNDYNIYAYSPAYATLYKRYAATPSLSFSLKDGGTPAVFETTGVTEDATVVAPDVTVAPAGWRTDYEKIVNITPMVEEGDWNNEDGVKPGKSIYFEVLEPFDDLDTFDFDLKKGENAKQIKSVKVIQDRFKNGLCYLSNHGVNPDTVGIRKTYIEVKLNDFMTDSEFKISFDLKVKADEAGYGVAKGTASEKFEEIGANWVANSQDTTDDAEFMAGTGGIVIKPVKNEENTVLWTDENRDLARLTFVADSDVAKYFPKLSTKWPNATYAQLFDDQDAFVFDFVGNPKISSTSRAVLELFCPFLDNEDEYTIDPESVVIYQVADDATLAASTEVELAKAILDGRLIDVTDKFTAGENEDGDFVYTTKTRTLGTYIIAEKAPSEEAFEEAEGEAPVEEPTENTEKPNPGTGR